jgi:hypothetical protein
MKLSAAKMVQRESVPSPIRRLPVSRPRRAESKILHVTPTVIR